MIKHLLMSFFSFYPKQMYVIRYLDLIALGDFSLKMFDINTLFFSLHLVAIWNEKGVLKINCYVTNMQIHGTAQTSLRVCFWKFNIYRFVMAYKEK